MKNLGIVLLLALTIGMFGGCKTTEANYRAAYEKAIAGRDSSDNIDATVYGNVRRQKSTKTVVTDRGDVEVTTQLVRVTADGGGFPEMLKRYNVVAGQFKQKFNAISLRNRIADEGWPGAFVVETGEPYYYVVAVSEADFNTAVHALNDMKANMPQGVRAPCPFILDATARRSSAKTR